MAPATKAHAEERLVEIRWARPDGYALRAAPLAPPLLAVVIMMATSKPTLCHKFTSQHGSDPAPNDGYDRSTVPGRAPVNLPFSCTRLIA